MANHDWEGLREGSCEDAAILFMTVLWTYLCSYIPFREVKMKKKSHPWLNKKCEAAILAKNNAQEGIDFEEKRRYCSQVLTEEYQSYVEVLKQKIADLKKGSKEWWKLNRELLNRKNKCSSIPPLRQDGEWKKSPYEKANTFAQKFQEKCLLPEEGIDCSFLESLTFRWTNSLL